MLSRKYFAGFACLQPREVVNGALGLFDQPDDLIDARPAGVKRLQRNAGIKSEIDDREDQGPEQRQVFLVERAVDEHVSLEAHRRRYFRFGEGGSFL
jgi:hypothetical protein